MRPSSEIHSALQLIEADLRRRAKETVEAQRIAESSTEEHELDQAVRSIETWNNLRLAQDVLGWVAGKSSLEISQPNEWLAGYLLDDPPKLDNTPPESN